MEPQDFTIRHLVYYQHKPHAPLRDIIVTTLTQTVSVWYTHILMTKAHRMSTGIIIMEVTQLVK